MNNKNNIKINIKKHKNKIIYLSLVLIGFLAVFSASYFASKSAEGRRIDLIYKPADSSLPLEFDTVADYDLNRDGVMDKVCTLGDGDEIFTIIETDGTLSYCNITQTFVNYLPAETDKTGLKIHFSGDGIFYYKIPSVKEGELFYDRYKNCLFMK